MSKVSNEDFHQLLALLDGTLPKEGFIELEKRLCNEPELRKAWIELRDQQAELEERFQSVGESQKSGRSASVKLQPIHWMALAALVGIGVWVGALLSNSNSVPGSNYLAVELPGLEEVAIVTQLGKDVKWQRSSSDLRVGSRLKPGTLLLESGSIELTFLSGALVTLVGPAELQLLSEKQAFLSRGKAAAKVPKEAIGFTIKSPDAAVVDLGTEFAMSVDQQGDSLVKVYDGEVRVSLIGEDGATLTSAPMLTGDSIEVHRRELEIVDSVSGVADATLPRVAPFDTSLLKIPPSYRGKIIEVDPVVYWDFDRWLEGQVSSVDLSENENHGDLVGSAIRVIENGANSGLHFEDSTTLQCVRSRDLVGSLDGDYSISLWVKPEKIHYGTLVGICTDDFVSEKKNQPFHLSVIELMHDSHLIHQTNAFRYLHRWGGGEMNTFSDRSFIPGKWHNVVTVREGELASLYINGELSKKHTITSYASSDSKAYRVSLGQIDHLRKQRSYSGLMDEFSLFSKPLSAKLIEELFQMVEQENPGQF